MFLVPYNKLSEEQKGIIRRVSREDKDLFVEGPPGSGKTLISLYTLRDIVEKESVRPLLLMYNHSLYGYLSTALRELDLSDNITIATKDKYFWDLSKQYNLRPSFDREISYEEKYNVILKGLLNANLKKIYDITVVDEVQDLTENEWILIKRLSKRIISLGDFDQGIYNTNLSKNKVIETGMFEKLKDIFRFHKSIAKLAQIFSNSKDNLEQKVSRQEQKDPQIINVDLNQEANTIADILVSLKNTRQRIGVICPDSKLLGYMSNQLKELNVDIDYYSNNKDLRQHDFFSTKPLLVSSFSAKGLEFEHVILFGFNHDNTRFLREQKRLNHVIYVSITRSNSNLYIITSSSTIPELKNIKLESSEEVSEMSIDDLF